MSQNVRDGSSVAQAAQKITITIEAHKPKIIIEGSWDGKLISAVSRGIEREYKLIKYNVMRKLTADRAKVTREAEARAKADAKVKVSIGEKGDGNKLRA